MPDEFEIEAPALDAVKHPALRGVTTDRGSGVVGVNHKNKSLGLLGGSDRVFGQTAGVYGESEQQGVFGHATNQSGTGVYGNSVGSGFGVRGDSTDGIAVQGQSFGNGLAGKFIGSVEITENLIVQGHNISTLISQVQSIASLAGRVQVLEQENQLLKREVDRLKQASSGGSQPGSSSTRQISVQKKDGEFIVTGFGFPPRVRVTIRVVAGNNPQDSRTFFQSSEPDGKLNFRQSIVCTPGVLLHFSATDDTLVSGQNVWSNTFDITC